jgi:galactokinase
VLDDETFRRVRHVVTENQRVLDTVRTLRTDGAVAIGALLDASHVSMRDDFEISVPELDLAVSTAQAAGAVGARMTGGGFGGSAIALVRSADRDAVASAVTAAFAEAGFTAPTVFTVHPAEGARRDG